jgi:hypothetical protein
MSSTEVLLEPRLDTLARNCSAELLERLCLRDACAGFYSSSRFGNFGNLHALNNYVMQTFKSRRWIEKKNCCLCYWYTEQVSALSLLIVNSANYI